ncbi:lipoyl(octanoyl) transferase LipB [Candidatus Gromoviella agglomerans]|uniref:lipoyl(octanoyl) transferase LipB n=1 Tax=Candidatus Gromoviella agglomerans TaxID=2806609 RepID=UPI001E4FAB61|nr:lipoyl(octanoyl) transferase LipB [Candidatus Gromoviella agglomerans]
MNLVLDGGRDKILFFEYEECYTIGRSGSEEDILKSTSIPVFHSSRGGKTTYHGPGQLIVYPIINLKKNNLYISDYVKLLQESIINTLNEIGIEAQVKNSVGVWTNEKKIASIGLRVKKDVAYHGASINISCNLSPFHNILTCGEQNAKVTSCLEMGSSITLNDFATKFYNKLKYSLDINISSLHSLALV